MVCTHKMRGFILAHLSDDVAADPHEKREIEHFRAPTVLNGLFAIENQFLLLAIFSMEKP